MISYSSSQNGSNMQVNVHTAKTNLSDLIAKAERGEDVVIARNGVPAVKLVPVTDKPRRLFGALKGRFIIPDDFDEPMSEEELRLWEGGDDEFD